MRSYPKNPGPWLCRTILAIVSLAWMLPAAAGAQSPAGEAHLLVESNAPEMTVYLDSSRLGTTEAGLWSIPAGEHLIKAAPVGVYSWSFEHETVVVTVSPGDTARVSLHFPYAYAVNSSPPGASVFHVDDGTRSKLGVTPLTHTSERPLGGRLVIDKVDYDSIHVAPGGQLWNSHRVELVGKDRSVAEKHVDLPPRREERTWLTYTAAGLAVSAGAAAVYFQRRANHLRSSDNAHERLRSREYEQLSNGSLVAMQLGVGVLAFQLVWD